MKVHQFFYNRTPKSAPNLTMYYRTLFVFIFQFDIDIKELEKKILEGIALAYQKLVEQKKKEDEELVFSQDGKIVVVKARDL